MSDAATPTRAAGRERPLHLGTVTVLLAGLILTSSLALGAQSLHHSNEGRLLRQRAREAGAVLTAAIPNVQTPLASAAVLAEATHAQAAPFEQLMTPLVSTGGQFISASLWSSGPAPRPLLVVGSTPSLERESAADVRRVIGGAVGRGTVMINNLLSASDRRLGYVYGAPGSSSGYVVYAEAALPKSRRARVDRNSAFADLDYSLYVGRAPVESQLIASSTGGVSPKGQRASDTVPFGNSSLLIVLTARKELGGELMARLPWGFAVVGLLLTLAGAFLVERLLRRRDHAETLARENDELYKEQRTVAQTLQHSLLPDTLPEIAGLELATRYVAGVEGIDIGGDWYDVMTFNDGHVMFVVGDVSGRGLRAATTMAELRYAVRAYAMQGDPPEVILTKVSRLINVGRDGQFATAVCGSIDVSGHTLTLANAGHPDPLLVAAADSRFVASEIGPPLGVANASPHRAVTLAIPSHATLLCYTDGLIERRSESLDVGLDRLKHAALDSSGSMEELLTRILAETIPTGSPDDTALLGIRWQN